MTPQKVTPMLQQYLSIKEKYPDAILMYRMGDFFEMFFEDAETAAGVLDIALTSRNKKDENPIPMCGVPHRAVSGYIARLIEKGFRVAVCDQIEDASEAKGLVQRDVVRVITPGTLIEDDLLDGKSNNFALAVARHRNRPGMAYLDVSTGTFRLTEASDGERLIDEIRRVAPREILMPASSATDPFYAPIRAAMNGLAETQIEDRAFELAVARERLTTQFGTLSLEGFGCEDKKAGVRAAGALLHYARETQRQDVNHITGIETYSLDQYLTVDALSCQNLELVANVRTGTRQGTLLGVMDKTVTAMGGRCMRQWLRYPLIDREAIEARHEAVADALAHLAETRRIRQLLKSVFDIERLTAKVAMGHANARDLTNLKQTLLQLPEIRNHLGAFRAPAFRFALPLEPLLEAAELIDRAIREDAPPTINDGDLIKPGYNAELDELAVIGREGKGWLVRLEAQEREATGINSLKVRYNKVFGYYIEVGRAHAAAVPAHYVRKQTLVNAERYITDELKQFENKVLGAEERKIALERRLFVEVRDAVATHRAPLREAAGFLAELDCLLTLAEIADQNDYHRPVISADGILAIVDGRHPVIEKMISGERFVPNTITLDDTDQQVLVITGPNMAGKSTVLRQVALTVIMAQMGSFVPAGHAEIGIVDRIFTRVGALDNLSQGQSTFMVEMQETANILNNATPRSLIIMDEIGRGTSTFDGLSIAWAVAEYLHDFKGRGVKTLFATHYHELTALADVKPRVKNFNIAVREWNDEIIFLRKLVEGGTNRSYGIQVARLAGIPPTVIKQAKKILFDIENGDHVGMGPEHHSVRETARGHVQLDLFGSPEGAVIRKLQKLDLTTMTPLEALNCLSDLQQASKAQPN